MSKERSFWKSSMHQSMPPWELQRLFAWVHFLVSNSC